MKRHRLFNLTLAASMLLGLAVVPAGAAGTEAEPVYSINHTYADFKSIDDVLATGRYFVGGGTDSTVKENNDIAFSLKDGLLTATAKTDAEGGSKLLVDLKDNEGNPLTGEVFIEYKLVTKNYKKTMVEPKGNGKIITTNYFQEQGGNGQYSSFSIAAGNGSGGTDWGKALPAAADNTYTVQLKVDTTDRSIKSLTWNGEDKTTSIGSAFRQAADGVDQLNIYQNAQTGSAGKDTFGLASIKVWQYKDVDPGKLAADDIKAITDESVLNGQTKDAVTDALNLVQTGEKGTAIRWSSTDEATVNPATGAVTRGTKDTAVTLTASADGTDETYTITVTVKAAEPVGPEIVYSINHTYTDFNSIDEVLATGRYFVGGGTDSTVKENNDIAFSLKDGLLTATAKTDAEGGSKLLVDLKDNEGNPLTGEVFIEYKLVTKNYKKTMVEPKGNGKIITTNYFQEQGGNGQYSSFSIAAGNGSGGTDWGKALPAAADNTYTVQLKVDTTDRSIKSLTWNGEDKTTSIGSAFRQAADGVDQLNIYQNAQTGSAGKDTFGLASIKVWQYKDVDPGKLAADDIKAITDESVLNGQTKDAVTDALNLVQTGEKGTAIRWSSTDEATVNPATGAVTRGTKDTAVTLTASADGTDETYTITVTVKAAEQQVKEEIIFEHHYADFKTIDALLATGRYYLSGIKTGTNGKAEDDKIKLRLEDGQLIATPKTETKAESVLEIDLKDNGQELTGVYFVEYQFYPKAVKDCRTEIRGGEATAYSMCFKPTAPSLALGKTDPKDSAATDWGPNLPKADSYVIRAKINTDTRMVEEFTLNGKDATRNGYRYFRQNMTMNDRLCIYDANALTVGEDNYGLGYMKVWREIESESVINQKKAQADADALTNAVVLGTQSANQIIKKLNLPTVGSVNGSQIVWNSSNPAVINPTTGAVADVTEPVNVTLTATANYGGQTASKVFNLTVIVKGTQSKYVLNEDFKYASVDEMLKNPLLGWTNTLAFLKPSMKDGTKLVLTRNGAATTSEGLTINLADYANRLNAQHYIEVKIKKTATNANWQVKLFPEAGNEFAVIDVSGGKLSWRDATGWTAAPWVNVTDTNELTLRMLIDFEAQRLKDVYVDDGSGVAADGIQTSIMQGAGSAAHVYEDGTWLPFMNGASNLARIVIYGNNNMADTEGFEIDYVKLWDSAALEAQRDLESLTVSDLTDEDPAAVTKAITLPLEGEENSSDITWTIDPAGIIGADGSITKPEMDTTVKLVASIEADGKTFTKEFYLNIKGKQAAETPGTEYDYIVYENGFDAANSHVQAIGSAKMEYVGGKLILSPDKGAEQGQVRVNLIDEQGASGIKGESFVEFTAGSEASGGTYVIYGSDGSELTQIQLTESSYTVVTKGKSFTGQRSEGFDVKLSFVFDTVTNTMQIWHNGMKAEGEWKPLTDNKDAAYLVMTTTGSLSIDSLCARIKNADRLKIAEDALSFQVIRGENKNERNIRFDLNLVASYILGTTVSWKASAPGVISSTGKVTRPEGADQNVRLTATISIGSETAEKTFDLIIKRFDANNIALEKPVEVNVKGAAGTLAESLLDGDDDTVFQTSGSERKYEITIDLEEESRVGGVNMKELQLKGGYAVEGYKILYSNDKNEWKEAYSDGTTIGEDKTVDFVPVTARYIKIAITEKALGAPSGFSEISVIFAPSDKDRVKADTDALELEGSYNVTSDIELPEEGIYGSTITWQSSHPDIISKDGKYSKPEVSTVVTLTATISYNGVTMKKSFKRRAAGESNGSGGTSGGGGGSRPSSGGGGIGSSSAGTVTGAYPYIPSETVSSNHNNNQVQRNEVFSDLAGVEWAKDYIYKLYDRGVVKGVSATQFAPNSVVTREQALQMIVNAFGIKSDAETLSFADVAENQWYTAAVQTAFAAGIVKGISETEFGIGRQITREDFAIMLVRAMQSAGIQAEGVAEGEKFNEVSDYAKGAMAVLNTAGIMTGDQNGNLTPKAQATRAQSAKMICMAMELK